MMTIDCNVPAVIYRIYTGPILYQGPGRVGEIDELAVRGKILT